MIAVVPLRPQVSSQRVLLVCGSDFGESLYSMSDWMDGAPEAIPLEAISEATVHVL